MDHPDAGTTVLDSSAETHRSRPILPPAPECSFTWEAAWIIAERVRNGEVSALEVIDHFLDRIEALDPRLHAFRFVDFEGARRHALSIDDLRSTGAKLGPLAGVPVAVKDFLAVEGMAWQDLNLGRQAVALRDGIEAERLRHAGAIIVGTTVSGLTARAFGTSPDQPHNPWNDERVCGDSSSGAACAVASAMVPMAFTTDGLGSTRIPAAYCGLAGMIATRGRVPSTDWTQLTSRLIAGVGPMARDVRDMARGLNAIAGPDARDFYCLPDDPPDYEASIGEGAEGLRLGWSDDLGSPPSMPMGMRRASSQQFARSPSIWPNGLVVRLPCRPSGWTIRPGRGAWALPATPACRCSSR